MLANHIFGGNGAVPPRGCREQPRVVLGRRVNRVHLGLRYESVWVGIFGKISAITVFSVFHIPICRVRPPRTLGLGVAQSPGPKLFDSFGERDSWRALASPCLATLNTLSMLVLLLLLLLLMLPLEAAPSPKAEEVKAKIEAKATNSNPRGRPKPPGC